MTHLLVALKQPRINNKGMADINNYLTVPEFAKSAGVTDQAVRKAITEKRIKAEMVGRQWLIKKSELKLYRSRA